MEDAATAEISRSQLWQWRVTRTRLEDGAPLTRERYERIRSEEMRAIRAAGAVDSDRLAEAAAVLDDLVLSDDFTEFLTIPAGERLH